MPTIYRALLIVPLLCGCQPPPPSGATSPPTGLPSLEGDALHAPPSLLGVKRSALTQGDGPNGEQVVSNYLASGNIYHQPDASYDALNQETRFTYDANRLLTSVHRPSGLTTTTNLAPASTAMSMLVVETMPPSTSSRPLISTGL